MNGFIIQWIIHSPNKQKILRSWEETQFPFGVVSGRASGIKICQIKYAKLFAVATPSEPGSSQKQYYLELLQCNAS